MRNLRQIEIIKKNRNCGAEKYNEIQKCNREYK